MSGILKQYCSLQHWALLLSPVTSTAGYCFCFGSIPSFFLECLLFWLCQSLWLCGSQLTVDNFLKTWVYQTTLPISWETCMWVKKQQLELDIGQITAQIWEKRISRLYIVTLLISLLCRVHYAKYWTGWIINWNQELQEKYQQLQICRWYHSNGRKWRVTKEPLDKGEREEWKGWLQTQH